MKAKIIHKSNIDASGFIRITFNVLSEEDVVLYEKLEVFCLPENVSNEIRTILATIQSSIETANLIEEGAEITL